MPIRVIETWESALTLCIDEAVGSLEQGPIVNDHLGEVAWRGRPLTIWWLE